jgi:hypothetical protein
MKTMPNASNPHSAYHAYDYWDVYGKYKLSGATEKMPTVYCRPKDLPTHPYDYCTLKPKVKIKDNWGWCTEGRDGVACPTPATAVCQNPDTLAIQVKPNCRDYSASFSSLDQTCLPSYKRCSDGYYESVGEVVIYNYSGE